MGKGKGIHVFFHIDEMVKIVFLPFYIYFLNSSILLSKLNHITIFVL